MTVATDARLVFQASLKRHREALGWTFADMGRAMGVSYQRAHELENSAFDPKLGTVAAVAGIFGKTVPEFLSHQDAS